MLNIHCIFFEIENFMLGLVKKVKVRNLATYQNSKKILTMRQILR